MLSPLARAAALTLLAASTLGLGCTSSLPPLPEVVVEVTSSQVPLALQTPEAQSAPTWQAGSLE